MPLNQSDLLLELRVGPFLLRCLVAEGERVPEYTGRKGTNGC